MQTGLVTHRAGAVYTGRGVINSVACFSVFAHMHAQGDSTHVEKNPKPLNSTETSIWETINPVSLHHCIPFSYFTSIPIAHISQHTHDRASPSPSHPPEHSQSPAVTCYICKICQICFFTIITCKIFFSQIEALSLQYWFCTGPCSEGTAQFSFS